MSGLMEEEDSMKRKKIYGIFMLVAIAVFLFAGGRILQIYLNYQESQKVYHHWRGNGISTGLCGYDDYA